MANLKMNSVTKSFGGLCAVADVSLTLNDGELIGLIGPNGAGKTTIFNLLTGQTVPDQGQVIYNNGHSEFIFNGLKPYKINQLGVARTFQNIRLYRKMTVLDNIKVAVNIYDHYNMADTILRTPRFYRVEDEITAKAEEILKVLSLTEVRDELAANLPYGEQRRLEIARALASNPKILLLDEPAAGMNPQETESLTELINQIRQQFSLSVLLIEHDMSLVMKICERIYVLDYGRLIAQGKPEEIKHNPKVITAYLGEE
jgi:branched-chain amino acid transport system ATP-binding protein